MNRLTSERVNGIKTGFWSPSKKQDLVDRLAEYENTGLMPNEIKDKLEMLQIYQSIGLTPDQIRWMLDRECWIPAGEKPTEDGVYVATMSEALVDQKEPFVGLAEFEDGNWVDGDNVIAWQPLPKPYRPERSNHDR